MDGFSSFFAASKTEYDELTGTVLCLAITGYNKQGVYRQSHDTEGNSQHSSQWLW
jgi:hypothetical protein